MAYLIITKEKGIRSCWNTSQLEKIYFEICKKLKRRQSILELRFVHSPTMRRLNKTFRGRNKPTDILSFPSQRNEMLGSLAIDIDTAKCQATRSGLRLKFEIEELFIHGVLHLFGFDHENPKDAAKMHPLEYHFRNRLVSMAKKTRKVSNT